MTSGMFCVSWPIKVTEPVWILDRVALAAHQRQLAEHGGLRGGFDRERLSEALSWPRRLYAAVNGSRRCEELAAAYAEAVIKLRPFEEGNLRAAFLLAMLFLRLNGISLPAPLPEKFSVFVSFVRGQMTRQSFAEWMAMRRLANLHGGRTVVRVRVSDNQVTQMTVLKSTTKAGRRKISGIKPGK